MISRTQEDIMKNWNMSEIDTPLVSVKCMTYNQEKYIGQCIVGFLMQKTSFPFEILIHDDCSTDDTTNIVLEYAKKYPKIIKPILEEENQYSKHDGSHHKKIDAAIKGKYVAFCEGDDYWIDENKLQKQVSYLESHITCGMVYAKSKMFIQDKQKFHKNILGRKRSGYEDLLFNGNNIPTQTVVIRTDLFKKYLLEINPYDKGWRMGDYPLWLYLMKNSDSFFFDEIFSVYRVLSKSAGHFETYEQIVKFGENYYSIRNYFASLYGIPEFTFDEKEYFINYALSIQRLHFNFNLADSIKKFIRKNKKNINKRALIKLYVKSHFFIDFFMSKLYYLYKLTKNFIKKLILKFNLRK